MPCRIVMRLSAAWGIKLEITAGLPTWEAFPGMRHQKAVRRISQSLMPIPCHPAGCGCFDVADVSIKFPDGSLNARTSPSTARNLPIPMAHLVITMMTQMDAPRSFSKGGPMLPATPTVYTVYIASKQWKNVAEAMQNPEDRLIVEGFAAFDAALEGIAVFVTNTTTRLLQQQKRQPA
jgi:hypothetical protein